jgi:hypothetical protein
MFFQSMPEISSLSKADKKAALRACRRKPYKHWQFWLSLIMILLAVPLINMVIGTIFFMFSIISRFDGAIFITMLMLPGLTSMLLFYNASKIQEYYLAPCLLHHIRANYPHQIMLDANEHAKNQRRRKKVVFISLPIIIVILSIYGLDIHQFTSYTPTPIPATIKEPRVEINKVGLRKNQALKLAGLGKITDIVRLQEPSAEGARLAIAGTAGAALIDDQLSVKKQIKFDGKLDPVSIVHLNGPSNIGYISRGSWANRPYLMDGSGKQKWIYNGGSMGVDDMAAGDLYGDGNIEYVVGFNGGGGVHLLNADGNKVWSQPDSNVWHVEIVDIDGDGHPKIVHSNAAGEITIRGPDGRVLSKYRSNAYFAHFSIIDLPKAKNVPHFILNNDEKIWIINFKGETIKRFSSPFSRDGFAKGSMVKLDNNDSYLGVIVDPLIWDRSVLYLYNSADELVYQEILPEACFSVYALPSTNGLHQSLLVGCKNVVWQYAL